MNKIISALQEKNFENIGIYASIIMFSMSNLGFIRMILAYLGVEKNITIVATVIFCGLDICIFAMYMCSMQSVNFKKNSVVLLMINFICILPYLIEGLWYNCAQYIVFAIPFSLTAAYIYNKQCYNKYFEYYSNVSKFVIIIPVLYIAIIFSGKAVVNGVTTINEFSYGDFAYAFLPFMTADLVNFITDRKKKNLIRSCVYYIAIIYTGTRSAIICGLFAILILIALYIKKSNLSLKVLIKYALISTGIICAALIFIFLAAPEGSRLNVVKGDFLYEFHKNSGLVVYDVKGKNYDYIENVFRKNIVSSTLTKEETEAILKDDIKKGTGKYIIVDDDVREEAMQYELRYNRSNLWKAAFDEFKKNILIGNGPLSFQNKYVGTYPHNIILEVMCDFGLVGVTVIIYILVIAIKQFLKSISDFKNNKWKIYVFVSAYLPQFLLYTTFYLNGILLFCFMTIILPFTSTLCLKKEREFRNAKNNGY